MMRIKLKRLEEYLQGVSNIDKPKIHLEQYSTPAHIASHILFNMQSEYGDLEGKMVGDLGCGSGMLSIGSYLLGAEFTIGFEIDSNAVNVFRTNVIDMELSSGIDCLQADVLTLPISKWLNVFDTIVMNPPFGTKNNSGIDMRFLQTALCLANTTVYSLHKTSTRNYISRKLKDWNVAGKVVGEISYNIDACYKFHRSKSVDIEVDLWRLEVSTAEILY